MYKRHGESVIAHNTPIHTVEYYHYFRVQPSSPYTASLLSSTYGFRPRILYVNTTLKHYLLLQRNETDHYATESLSYRCSDVYIGTHFIYLWIDNVVYWQKLSRNTKGRLLFLFEQITRYFSLRNNCSKYCPFQSMAHIRII